MSIQTITRHFINSPLPALLAYFFIMLAGGCYAYQQHKKSGAPVAVTRTVTPDNKIVH